MTVRNSGSRAGTDVVQVYALQPTTHDIVLAPPRRLVGFARVTLGPGESKRVQVPLALSALATTPGDIDSSAPPRVRSGDYQLAVGTLTAPLAIR